MKMKFLASVFIAVLIGVECRSNTSSSAKDAGEKAFVKAKQLEELITLYEKNFAKLVNLSMKASKDKDNNKRKIQFLNQLGSLTDQLTREQSKVRNTYAKLDNDTNFTLQTPNDKLINTTKSMKTNINTTKNLIHYMKKIDTVYQNTDAIDKSNRIKRHAKTKGYKKNHKHIGSMYIKETLYAKATIKKG